MQPTLYFDTEPINSRKWSWKLLSPLYAEIVLDLQARDLKDRLFTYRVPEFLAEDVFVGAQVLVPFGNQDAVGGYVVSLLNEPQGDFKIKDISEVVEPDPLFDKEFIDFLGWIAFRSCARLSDVIQAAIPASLAPRIKRLVQIARDVSAEELMHMQSVLQKKDPAGAAILAVLLDSKDGSLSFKVLKQRFRKASRLSLSHFYNALRFLRNECLIKVAAESEAKTAPKMVMKVMRCQAEPRTSRQREVAVLLERNKGIMNLADLLKESRTTRDTIYRMKEHGILDLIEMEVVRDPMKAFQSQELESNGAGKQGGPPPLTEHQEQVLSVLAKDLKDCLGREAPFDRPVDPWLLHGVTGSGKTEVYLRLIAQTLQAGRTALLMVPEISLTPQLASRLQSRFAEKVSIWHSAISAGERYDTWRRLRSGDVAVLLGARSAVLANIPELGLIILDEEHDGSYKQSSPSPRYNAKEVALEKARRHGAMVVFGSATPDIVVYNRAAKAGRILELPERVHKQPMPQVRIVDMKEELRQQNRSILSEPLQAALKQRLEAQEQSILLINRRGYASHVFCRACGHVMRCKNCSVSLVYHRTLNVPRLGRGESSQADAGALTRSGYLSCHHCGFERGMMKTCPACSSSFIKEYGLGTQQVEETVCQMFPSARLLRLDSDVVARKGAYRDVFEKFSRGEADILIGTQMVAKGLDVANVTLVGVLVADASLNMPDYRATERGFQLLSQVAGRAGRGQKPGEVILQTYNPELEVIHLAKNHDFRNFYLSELACREAFSYPPFSRIIRIVMQGTNAPEVEIECERLAEEISVFLEGRLPESSVQILGPSPCIIEKVKNNYRFHLLIKVKDADGRSFDEDPLNHLLYLLRNKKTPKQLSMAIDVDALDLL